MKTMPELKETNGSLDEEREGICQDLVKGGLSEAAARGLIKNVIGVGRRQGASDDDSPRG